MMMHRFGTGMRTVFVCHFLFLLLILPFISYSAETRKVENFGKGWKFTLGDITGGQEEKLDDSPWRTLNLPHDWSIEGSFSKDNPASPGGGALPGGIGWYRKSFSLPIADKNTCIFIDFDGVYRNSEVWINGKYLGLRPYGYSSFRYELTSFLKFGKETNVIAVKVDNSKQPNSRWYSGSGIYRNVWLVTTDKIYVDHWGTYVTTPEVSQQQANVVIQTNVRNTLPQSQSVILRTSFLNSKGKEVARVETKQLAPMSSIMKVEQNLIVKNPVLWSMDKPYVYRIVSKVLCSNREMDSYETTLGIRSFVFDTAKGFILNGKHVKINGVCNHHDLGCLGAAINRRALERQLELMKGMGVNGIRTSHNPPAPELLDLCDRMGFIVMDEAFDMWKKGKTEFDYSKDWDEWHVRDIQDMVYRDRNHASIFIWSIGNEITEQYDHKDSSGGIISRELCSIVRALDGTRPITSNCNDPSPENTILKNGSLDMIGYSYHLENYGDVAKYFPGKPFVGSETVSSLNSRGSYDMPSDSIRRWPARWDVPIENANADLSCSDYDNCSAPWGSTHEESWRVTKKSNFVSGQYIWTGFDYLGEPTPYPWPARSSYFGIFDLAGFPKNQYYMYKSEWTKEPVLHMFPHWNWKKGQTIDVWAYTNCDEVELFLNGISMGTKKKIGDALHLMWRLAYVPGTLKAIGRTQGKEVLTQEIKTAGVPAKITLEADRSSINADGKDLSFITVKVLDEKGTIVPLAENLIRFNVSGKGSLVGVDNGHQTNLESFKASEHKVFHGLGLAVVQSKEKAGRIVLRANADGLQGSSITIQSK
jgi:beta-galactosidase